MPLVPAEAWAIPPGKTLGDVAQLLRPLVPDWDRRSPRELLEAVMRAADDLSPGLTRDCMDRLHAERGSDLVPVARIRGIALPYNRDSEDERVSFAPGCLAATQHEIARGVRVDVRCHHDSRTAHVGRVTRLRDEDTSEGRACVFDAVLYDRVVAEQTEQRLQRGAVAAISVGVGAITGKIVQRRADGGRHYVGVDLIELSLCNQPRMLGARVTEFAWLEGSTVYEETALWQQRRAMVAESRRARGLYEHRDCGQLRGACDFSDARTIKQCATRDDPRQREKERLRQALPVVYRHIWPAAFLDRYLDSLVGAR